MLRETYLRARLRHRAWRYRLKTERAEIAFVLRNLKKNQTAVDAGAHKGAFTYWMARRVGAAGRVLAFEPLPQLAAYLCEMKELMRWRQVSVVESALSDVRGQSTLYIPDGYLGTTTLVPQNDSHRMVTVDLCLLDEFCRDLNIINVDFIKADVEGFELNLFRGCIRILETNRPILLFECADWLRPDNINNVFSLMKDLNYTGIYFKNNIEVPISEFSIEKDQYGRDNPRVNFGFYPT